MREETPSVGGRKLNSTEVIDIETAMFAINDEVMSHLTELDRICHEEVVPAVSPAVAALIVGAYVDWVSLALSSPALSGPGDPAALRPMGTSFHGRRLRVGERREVDTALSAVEALVRPHLDDLRRIHDETYLPMVSADLADQANRLFIADIHAALQNAAGRWLDSEADDDSASGDDRV